MSFNIPLDQRNEEKDNLLNGCLWNTRSVCNKAQELSDYILDDDINILLVTETWLSIHGEVSRVIIGTLVLAGYSIIHVSQAKGRGGDAGIMF